jgi:hypothetical protein
MELTSYKNLFFDWFFQHENNNTIYCLALLWWSLLLFIIQCSVPVLLTLNTMIFVFVVFVLYAPTMILSTHFLLYITARYYRPDVVM